MTGGTKFQIFRRADARGLMESGVMAIAEMTAVQKQGMGKLAQAGYLDGDEVHMLVDVPGFSLAHAWLKKDYPLTRHSHNVDCLYYVVAGTLQLGTETVGPQDCFFVPANVPYRYVPGPEGVEVLEFRHAGKFDFVNLSSNERFYAQAAETIAAVHAEWKRAQPPSQLAGRSQGAEHSGEVIDRFFGALSAGDIRGMKDCCTADAKFWHSFDQKEVDLAEMLPAWEGLSQAMHEVSFVDVRRNATPGGFVQQHVMIAGDAEGKRKGWPICVMVKVSGDLIERLDEYMDRAGAFAVPAGMSTAPGLPSGSGLTEG